MRLVVVGDELFFGLSPGVLSLKRLLARCISFHAGYLRLLASIEEDVLYKALTVLGLSLWFVPRDGVGVVMLFSHE